MRQEKTYSLITGEDPEICRKCPFGECIGIRNPRCPQPVRKVVYIPMAERPQDEAEAFRAKRRKRQQKEWYQRNKEEHKANMKAEYHAWRKKIDKRHYEKNREVILEKRKAYYEKNKDRINSRKREARRQRKEENMIGETIC